MADPKRDMDERLNIEGEPADVLRALLSIPPECDEPATPWEPATGDEAIEHLLGDE